MTLRVLCFGGRDYNDVQAVNSVLDWLRHERGDFLVIQGGARGADALCKAWAVQHGLPVIQMDAPWSAYGKAAGSLRNGWMLEHAMPNYAVKFPGGRGTADMKRRVQEAGVTLWEPW